MSIESFKEFDQDSTKGLGKLTIIYLSSSLLPSERANSVHVMQMCNAFASLGHQVVLWGLKGKEENVHQYYGTTGFKLRRPVPPIKGALYIHALISALSLRKDSNTFIFGRSQLGLYCAALFGHDVVFETHSPIAQYTGYKRRIVERLISSKHLKGIVVISNALKTIVDSELAKRGIAIKCLAVHDGASLDAHSEFHNSSERLAVNNRLRVGYVGSVSSGRGIELLVKLANNLPNFDFHLIGASQAQILELGVASADITTNIIFHGFVSPVKAKALRSEMDVLVAPYQRQVIIQSGKDTSSFMSPLKIFEYMASAKAIIASDLPVLKEILTHDVDAVLVDPENTEQWINALIQLSNDGQKRKRLGEAGREKIVSHFNWKRRAQTIFNHYNQRK